MGRVCLWLLVVVDGLFLYPGSDSCDNCPLTLCIIFPSPPHSAGHCGAREPGVRHDKRVLHHIRMPRHERAPVQVGSLKVHFKSLDRLSNNFSGRCFQDVPVVRREGQEDARGRTAVHRLRDDVYAEDGDGRDDFPDKVRQRVSQLV